MEKITSRSNPLLVRMKKLAASASYRRQQGVYLCDSPKLLAEALKWHAPVREIVVTAGTALPPLSGEIRTVEVPEDVMASISPMKTPQGALFTCALPEASVPPVLPGSRYMVLDGVQDPGNMGTIIRIADWFGIDTILCSPDTADAFNPKVVQATMGSIARVRIVYTDLVAFCRKLPADYPVYGTLLDGSDIYRQPLTAHGIIVMGNEGKGISPALRQLVNRRLLIPQFGGAVGAESLNVAIATAITCSEFRRRQ